MRLDKEIDAHETDKKISAGGAGLGPLCPGRAVCEREEWIHIYVIIPLFKVFICVHASLYDGRSVTRFF